jgi:hypothetical protein
VAIGLFRYMMVCHAVTTYNLGDQRLWSIIHRTVLLGSLAMAGASYLSRYSGI